MTTQGPQFDMMLNPCYQIDCAVASSGKRVAATKRRVRFRFGFSDARAISEGAYGPECRGVEHEVSFVWSLTSGKRLVVADGREVHFSRGSRTEGKFETSWNMVGSHVMKLIAHATPPLFPIPGFRQFDLLLDGMSFFSMPYIYELGTKKAAAVVPCHTSERDQVPLRHTIYTLSPQEENDWTQSICTHEHRLSMHVEQYTDTATNTSQGFPRAAESLPTSTPMDLMSNIQDYPSAPIPLMDQVSPSFSSVSNYDEFAPVAPAPLLPSWTNIQNNIMGAYGQTTAPAMTFLALTNGAYTPVAPDYAPQVVTPVSGAPFVINHHTSVPTIVPNDDYKQNVVSPIAPGEFSCSIGLEQEQVEESCSEVGHALRDLVNIDDITVPAETPEKLKLTMMKQQDQENKENLKHSTPLPPVVGAWHLGSRPTLSDMKATSVPREPTQEVMKAHSFDVAAAQARMLTLYGATATSLQQQYHQHSDYNYERRV